GNYYNFWLYDTASNTFDLTRKKATKKALTVPTLSKGNSSITFAPERSALVIIDMQNFFLHPELRPGSELGRIAVDPTLKMIDAFRAQGMPIAWVNWGITEYDMDHLLSPSFMYNFAGDKNSVDTLTFCSEMGTIANGTIDMGKKLCRGSWNAEMYGPLQDSYLKGKELGTDFYFDKNTASGLWGVMTPLEMWLHDTGITTMFFGGVNTDQCVYGTMLDSSYKGYDTVMVTDICATGSPQFATDMVVYNMNGRGWVTNTGLMLPLLNA
ncbi:Isochorismatase hydrolase, partial [Calocera cornea HHB12733]